MIKTSQSISQTPISPSTGPTLHHRTFAQKVWRSRILYLLILPTVGLVLVFNYFPIVLGFYYSFTRYDGMRKN